MGRDISFGDTVRVVDDNETRRGGWAGLVGQCYGHTTPSITDIEVIGGCEGDLAVNVHFEDDSVTDAWFHPDLVEYVDHAVGTEATIGNVQLVRDATGEWHHVEDGDT